MLTRVETIGARAGSAPGRTCFSGGPQLDPELAWPRRRRLPTSTPTRLRALGSRRDPGSVAQVTRDARGACRPRPPSRAGRGSYFLLPLQTAEAQLPAARFEAVL